jgi:hypothetical protein
MGLTEVENELKLLRETMDKSKKEKEKKFRIPFGKKVGRGQKKKNYITVVKLMENGNLSFKKYKIDNQTFIDEGIPRLASAGYVYYWKKNPFIFLPNWSVEPLSEEKNFKPFNKEEDFKDSIKEGRNTVAYQLLMARMESEKIVNKKKIGGWLPWVIGIILAGIIIYAIFFTGGAK